jgi:hypothetical protein
MPAASTKSPLIGVDQSEPMLALLAAMPSKIAAVPGVLSAQHTGIRGIDAAISLFRRDRKREYFLFAQIAEAPLPGAEDRQAWQHG